MKTQGIKSLLKAPKLQECVEALLIESGLSLPDAFRYKQPTILPPTPLPPRARRTTFRARWHRTLKSVTLIQGRRPGWAEEHLGNGLSGKPRNRSFFQGQLIRPYCQLKLIHHASIHPVSFGEFSFSPTYGQILRKHSFLH